MANVRSELVAVWSMHDAQFGDPSIDEMYVFGEDQLGACIYANRVAQDFELFRWTCDADRLTFEPLRSVWVGRDNVTPVSRRAGNASTVRLTLAVERDPWGGDAWMLRLVPRRGAGDRYAKSLLSEVERQALQRYLGLSLGPAFAKPRQQTYP